MGQSDIRLGDVFLATHEGLEDSGFLFVASAYLVVDDKVLLVHHNVFNKWVPPGGHLVPNETFAEAAERECLEETGLRVRALSAAPVIHEPDANARSVPCPFYVDRLDEGFRKPCIAQYFFVSLAGQDQLKAMKPEEKEVYEVAWFEAEKLAALETFDQVRSLARWAIAHHPDAISS